MSSATLKTFILSSSFIFDCITFRKITFMLTLTTLYYRLFLIYMLLYHTCEPPGRATKSTAFETLPHPSLLK
jgi:hypothetical protein